MTNKTTTGSDAVDLDRLEKLASNAEQMFGKWFSTHQIADGITDDDAAAFIAAMTPGTVVALIAQARAAAPFAIEYGRIVKADERAMRAADALDGMGFTYDEEIGWLPPKSAAAPAATAPNLLLDRYDAGLLSDFGGGNVEWWQDYLRAELERAHDHYQTQADGAVVSQQPVQAAGDEPERECDAHDYQVYSMDGKQRCTVCEKEWMGWDSVAAPTAPTDEPKDTPESMANSNARFAIDGAIAFGREGVNKPPSEDHWLYEYWSIGQQLAKLGETSGWDNVTPLSAPTATAEPVAHVRDTLNGVWAEIADEAACDNLYDGMPLYAAPAPQQAAPLTDARIAEMIRRNTRYEIEQDLIDLCRDVEHELSAGSAASAGDALPTRECSMSELLAAPTLYSQVYVAATVFNGWEPKVAREAADSAAKEYGDAPATSLEALRGVLDEVLRTDGEAMATKEKKQ